MRRFPALLLILFCLAVTSAAPRPDERTKKFVGAWRLVSIEGNSPAAVTFMTGPPPDHVRLFWPYVRQHCPQG